MCGQKIKNFVILSAILHKMEVFEHSNRPKCKKSWKKGKKSAKQVILQTFSQNLRKKVSRDQLSTKFDTSLDPVDVKN